MSPTLASGDYIIVSKISYGPRVINVWKLLFFEKKLEYNWYKGFGSVKKDDVFVFNLPQYSKMNNKYPQIYGEAIVKRCYGLQGDTVKIKNAKTNYFGGVKIRLDLYPHDNSLNWTIDNYGPLWVPGKGKVMSLNLESARHYMDVLLFEGSKINISNDSVYLNGKYSASYTFKYNYYFMMGDNFYNSNDSRYWGFVPQTHVIGKVILVLFSIDPDKPWYECFKWGRFLKRVR
jgi:signal peptidase I